MMYGQGHLWIAMVAAALASPAVLRLLTRIKSRQTIYEHAPETHQAKQGTPTMGGLIILFGLLVSWVYYYGYVAGGQQGVWHPEGAFAGKWSVLILLIGFATIGFVDDFVIPRMTGTKRGLGWKQKIVMQLLVSGAGAYAELANGQATLSAVATLVFLILFFANAYNFADGLDALAGSLLLALLVGVGYLGQLHGGVGFLTLALVGATIPFLIVNAPPAKVFMGDVGSLPIGALIGLMFYWLASPPAVSALAVPPVALIVLGFMFIAELLPVPMQVGYYKLTKRRLFPMTPIHHAFEKKGWKESRVLWSFFLAQVVLSLAAVQISLLIWSAR